MTNLDRILKSRDITFPTKVCLVKGMVFPVVMHTCERLKRKLSAKELMLLNCGVGEDSWEDPQESWTARRSNQSILKEISPGCSLEGLMLKLKLPVFWPPEVKSWLIWKASNAGKDWGQEEKGLTEDEMVGWHHQLSGHGFGWTPGVGDGQGGLGVLRFMGLQRVGHDSATKLNWISYYLFVSCTKFFKGKPFLISFENSQLKQTFKNGLFFFSFWLLPSASKVYNQKSVNIWYMNDECLVKLTISSWKWQLSV